MADELLKDAVATRCRLLVVDDEENVLTAIRRQLHKTFDVAIATSADQALDILRDLPIDVVLSDQRMPGTTGAEFLAQVRREFPEVIRLMLTGYADINAVIAAINDGHVEHYIHKPWDVGELERIIAESYEVHRLRIANAALTQKLEAALQAEKHLNQLRANFILLVSHEFRTPLAVIMTSAETVRIYRDRLEKATIDKKLELISEQVQQITRLIEEVTAIGSYEQGVHPFHPKKFDICAEFQESIDRILASMTSNHIIVPEVPEPCPGFVGDSYLISQIVTELINNAIKFSPPAGIIVCRLEVDTEKAEISIADEGSGIPEKELEQVFKPFIKGQNASFAHGLGLGLAIVRHAVNLHQGQISVETNAEGGTTIRVVLPSLIESATLGHN